MKQSQTQFTSSVKRPSIIIIENILSIRSNSDFFSNRYAICDGWCAFRSNKNIKYSIVHYAYDDFISLYRSTVSSHRFVHFSRIFHITSILVKWSLARPQYFQNRMPASAETSKMWINFCKQHYVNICYDASATITPTSNIEQRS